MPPRKTNGAGEVAKHNGHVSLAREEYDALVQLRDETNVELVHDVAAARNRAHDLVQTCNAQAKRMAEQDLMIANLERVTGLQRTLLDLLRGGTSVASLEDLSEFWRRWQVCVGNAVSERKLAREEAAKFEPDLFRTWRNWVLGAGKADRTLAASGSVTTREERDRAVATEGRQDQTFRQLREDNERLERRLAQLEDEVAYYKNNMRAVEVAVDVLPAGGKAH